MICACGEKMKKREQMKDWEKLKWWECPKCQAVNPIARRPEPDRQVTK